MFKWIYKKLEKYFVSRWWENWLNDRLQKIWEEGGSLESIDLPKEVESVLMDRIPDVSPLVTGIDVYESDFGTTRINWL